MKVNKKNVIIPTLMLSVGLGLVGSISGTVAWYQYSTRVQAAFLGTSVKGDNVNMELKINNGAWKQSYTTNELASEIVSNEMKPVTTGELAKDAELPATFRRNPVYQYAATNTWKPAVVNEDYVQFKLSFRVKDIDGSDTVSYVDKDVYLVDLTIKDATNGLDLSDAVRVHLATDDTKALMAKTATATDVFGALDLNNDGEYDQEEGYEWDTVNDLVYGDENKQQESYAANVTDGSEVIAVNDFTYEIPDGKLIGLLGPSGCGKSTSLYP